MELSIKKLGPVLIVSPQKKQLTAVDCTAFKERLQELIAEGYLLIIMNMEKVESLDSTALGALLNIGLKIKSKKEGRFAFCHISAKLGQMFSLTNVNAVIPTYSDENAAMMAMGDKGKHPYFFLYVGKEGLACDILLKGEPSLYAERVEDLAGIKSYLKKEELIALIIEEAAWQKHLLATTNKEDSWQLPIIVIAKEGEKDAVDGADRRSEMPGIRHLVFPFAEEEAKSLMLELIEFKRHPANSQAKTTLLFQKYADAWPKKLSKLHELLATAKEHPSQETFDALRADLHKISGSAGSYGFVKLGEASRQAEELLTKAVLNRIFNAGLLAAIDAMLAKMAFYSEAVFAKDQSYKNASNLSLLHDGGLYLLSEDDALAEMIRGFCSEDNVAFFYTHDAQEAKQHLQEIKPKLLLVDNECRKGSSTGVIATIKELKSCRSFAGMQVGILVAGEDLALQVEASEIGVDMILTKPLSITETKRILKLLCPSGAVNYKVLVVDDDVDMSNLIKASLAEAGLEVFVQNDESKILDSLHRHTPNLLLLDVNMPQYSGLSLLKMLRSNLRYSDLKVVLVTANTMALQGLSSEGKPIEGYDEIWAKPLTKEFLQQKVLKIAAANACSDAAEERILTSFLPEKEFCRVLSSVVDNLLPMPGKYFVAIAAREYAEIAAFGKGALREFLANAETIFSEIKGDALRGYVGKGQFCFLFTAISIDKLKSDLEEFLKSANYKITVRGHQEIFATLSALIVVFQNKVSIAELLDLSSRHFSSSRGSLVDIVEM